MLNASTVNSYSPVAAISVNKRTGTAIVHRKSTMRPPPKNQTGNKKAIRYLSQSSLNKLALTVLNTSTQFVSMLTLTYLSFPSGKQAKSDLNRLLQWLGRKAKRALGYLWFMEFTRKGRIHFHVLLDLTPSPELLTSLSIYWSELTEPFGKEYTNSKGERMTTREAVRRVHSHKKTWEPIRLKDGAKRYALKYALKTRQKQVPEGFDLVGRFWGTDRETGKIDWSEFETTIITEKQLREYLWLDNHPTKKFDVIPKYLFNLTL